MSFTVERLKKMSSLVVPNRFCEEAGKAVELSYNYNNNYYNNKAY